MENIFDSTGKFIGQNNLGWTFTFEANGKYPIIANRIFETYSDVSVYMNSTTAIPGLLLRVVADPSTEKNGIYLLLKDSSGNLITDKVAKNKINVENLATWAIYDEEKKIWIDVSEGTPGAKKVLKSVVGDTTAYLSVDTLVNSYNFTTKEYVDTSIDTLNSSVQNNIDNMTSMLNQSITDVSVNLYDVSQRLNVLNDIVVDLSSFLDENIERIDTRLDVIDDFYISEIDTSTVGDFLTLITDVSRDPLNPSTGKHVEIKGELKTVYLHNSSSTNDGLATAWDTRSYITKQLQKMHSFEYRIVESLDDINVDATGMWVIYLIRTEDEEWTRHELDLYDEYIVIQEDDPYHTEPQYRLELIGNTNFDLSQINTSINILDASVRRINGSINDINSSLDRINTSIDNISNYLSNEIVNSVVVDSANNFLDITNYDISRGNVRLTVDVSLIEQYDNDDKDGVVTANYVETRMSWDTF